MVHVSARGGCVTAVVLTTVPPMSCREYGCVFAVAPDVGVESPVQIVPIIVPSARVNPDPLARAQTERVIEQIPVRPSITKPRTGERDPPTSPVLEDDELLVHVPVRARIRSRWVVLNPEDPDRSKRRSGADEEQHYHGQEQSHANPHGAFPLSRRRLS